MDNVEMIVKADIIRKIYSKVKVKVPLDIQSGRVQLQGTVLIPVSKPYSQSLSEDSLRGHMASTTRHGTLLPSHFGGTYLSTCICMLLNCQVGRSWDKRPELTPLCGFNLMTAGLLTLQHRGFCGLTCNTTTSQIVLYTIPLN